jgi:preprotein translocase subunit YajC
MYFISIRPQKKQQQKRQEMLKEMAVGDKAVTLGGLKGTIHSINRDDKEIVIDCDGVYLTFDLNFIRRTTPVAKTTTEAKPEEKAETKESAEATETKEAPKAEEKAAETKEAEPEAKEEDTKEEN